MAIYTRIWISDEFPADKHGNEIDLSRLVSGGSQTDQGKLRHIPGKDWPGID
ncbi:hypothetical protein G8759_26780 [Spirosoma aureum]|uniref:Uncharacterized protein n=1 Tax=Spirosoma aureum TaxID=2692134 RepID=A0A6G9AU17_9BACT|nr:hypothetical protein [Spirosoma aureum]QIP15982.1 hypothetical protein G8759_26780 [Spirosoma aureum]